MEQLYKLDSWSEELSSREDEEFGLKAPGLLATFLQAFFCCCYESFTGSSLQGSKNLLTTSTRHFVLEFKQSKLLVFSLKIAKIYQLGVQTKFAAWARVLLKRSKLPIFDS